MAPTAASAVMLLDGAHGTQLQQALKALTKLLANVTQHPSDAKHVLSSHAAAAAAPAPPRHPANPATIAA